MERNTRRESGIPSDALNPMVIDTGTKIQSPLRHVTETADHLYKPAIGMYTLWHAVLVNPVFARTKKRWGKEGWENSKLTSKSKPHGIEKGQVPLNQIYPRHETPLWSPNEIDLHSEGNDIIPNKHCTSCDCSEKSGRVNLFVTA